MRGLAPSMIASASASVDLADAAATDRRRPPSSPRPSRCCRSRRRSAGRAAASPIGRVGSSRAAAPGSGRSRTRAPSTSGPSAARRRSKRERASVISSSSGPSNCTTSRPPRGAPATPGAASAASARRRVDTPQAPVIRRCECSTRSPSKRRNRCLPCVSIRSTARPRAAGASGPARAARCGVAISSGTRPSSTGRIRSRPGGSCRPRASLGAHALSVSRRGPSWKPSAISAGPERRAERRLAVDLLEREAPDPAGADVLDERRQRGLEPRVVGGDERLSARPPRSR